MVWYGTMDGAQIGAAMPPVILGCGDGAAVGWYGGVDGITARWSRNLHCITVGWYGAYESMTRWSHHRHAAVDEK